MSEVWDAYMREVEWDDGTEGGWALDLICCGRDDGTEVFASWSDANEFRLSYVTPIGHDNHDRAGIIRRALEGERARRK